MTQGISEDDVYVLKRELADANRRRNELEGAKQTVLARLKEEFGVDNLEDATTKLKAMSAELDSLDKQLKEVLNQLDKFGLS